MMKRLAEAWAFAAILLLPNYIDLTSSAGDARMRSPAPLMKVALAHLTDMAIVALLFAAVLALLRRLPAWPRIRWALIALLPPLLLARNLDVIPFEVPWSAVFGFGLLWIGLLTLLAFKAPKAVTRLTQIGSSLVVVFAVFAFIMTWQLGRAMLWRPGPQKFAAAIPKAPADRPRLVWIIFDELAYRPIFETRDPSLKMPNFDRFRQESTLYSDMTPIADRTTRVVPSLLLGKVVTDVAYTADNQYLVQSRGASEWQPFDVNASLFGMAKRYGIATAIVGWYIAYCPVFSTTATECYWSNEDAQDRGPTSLDRSFAENVWFPLRILVERAFAPGRAWADAAAWNQDGHIASVKDLQKHALQTIEDSQADILYLHLPAPHPAAFWDRKTGRFAMGGSYLDSLDFSDRLFGKILNKLEAQPRWAATTLIVQGDHSWRTYMWRPLPGWSAEDERISDGGKFDPRPLLMIHTPGQQNASTVATPTSVMLVHDKVAGEIKTIANENSAASR